MTIADSYVVQKVWVKLKQEKRHAIWGHKAGLTSSAMQLSWNIDEPGYDALFDYMFYQDGAALPIENFILPRIEAALAFSRCDHKLVSPARCWTPLLIMRPMPGSLCTGRP